MKSILLKVGLLTTLSVGLVTGKTSAAEMDWATKCLPMGKINPNENPNYQQINCLLTNAALSKNIPPEVVKAVAEQESAWRQFDANGKVVSDGPDDAELRGYGIMQVTDSVPDQERVKSDIIYNIDQGVNILNQKYELQNSSSIPRIKGAGREIIENWYFPVMAYNGIVPANSPIFRSGGARNWNTYQDKVFSKIEDQSFYNDTKLAQYPFEYNDFEYDTNNSKYFKFNKLEYILTDELHESGYLLKQGDKVIVTENDTKLRERPTRYSAGKEQPLNKTFIISGDFKYTEPNSSDFKEKHYVWFPVKSTDGALSGYISSAYLAKKKDFVDPVVTGVKNNSYYNKDVKITYDEGTALLNGVAFNNGNTVTKEGKYTLVVKDEESNTTTITFTIDKTRPVTPYMNSVSDLSTTVTGKAEAGSTVKLSINGKYQKSTTAAPNGSFKFTIYKQKSGIIVSVTSTDKAGNVSPVRSKTVVDKTPPAITKINTVTTKSKSVSGSAEKYATIRIYKGSTLLNKGAVYSTGKFSVAIPAQKVNTYLKVTVTDKAGNVNSRTIKVVK
ncbi:transglycosylase SLT domain-containing protein [Bacillus sp. sid0103]|uniref:Ig-like domain-containing protein n=1 Tax=Bacillus sp. sid0103 TaxID=2856337 RepID=UPI001C453A70|nr:Ig-like domain-containing protein [Bacillus sp. sid0103]MBV7504826.1 transglycosylase SLT domain-containing protein [Bacillus sp. sid0103]